MPTRFEEIYIRFNSDSEDDPDEGEKPGSSFEVASLQVRGDDPDGLVGRIEFPEEAPGILVESITDESLGMPMDLNGDGQIDDENRSEDFQLLPVRIIIEWQGMEGLERLEYHTILMDN